MTRASTHVKAFKAKHGRPKADPPVHSNDCWWTRRKLFEHKRLVGAVLQAADKSHAWRKKLEADVAAVAKACAACKAKP